MKDNKAVQFFVGCAVIWLAFRLQQEGWFELLAGYLFGDEIDGVEGATSDVLLSSLLSIAFGGVCFIGVVALSVFGLISKSIKPTGMKLLRLLDSTLEKFGVDIIEFDDELPVEQEIDVPSLEEALNGIISRLDELEK